MLGLLGTCLVAYAGLRFVVRPRAVTRFESGPARSWGRFLQLRLVALAMRTAGLFTLSVIAAVGLFYWTTAHDGSLAGLVGAIERVRALRATLVSVGDRWATVGCIALLPALVLLAVWRWRTTWGAVRRAAIEQELADAERWEPRAPSTAMRRIAERIDQVRSSLIERKEAAGSCPGAPGAPDPATGELEAELLALHEAYRRCDAARRVDADFDPAGTSPPARTPGQKAGTVIASRGLFALVWALQRWLADFALALVVPCSLYVAGQAMLAPLTRQEVALEDLRVSVHERASLAQLGPEQTDVDKWTADDDGELTELSRAFEQLTVAAVAASQNLPATIAVPPFAAVQRATRDVILRDYALEHGLDVHIDDPPEPPEPPPPAGAGARPPRCQGPACDGAFADLDDLERRFVRDAKELVRKRPGVWQRIKQKVAIARRSFTEVVPLREVGTAFVAQVLASVIGGDPPFAPPVARRAGYRFRAQIAAFLATLSTASDRAEVEQRMRDVSWAGASGPVGEMIKDFPAPPASASASGRPALHPSQRSPHDGEFEELARSHKAQRSAIGTPSDPNLDTLQSYDDWFSAGHLETPRDRTRANWGLTPTDKTESARTAYVFARSDAAKEVGGVVFGPPIAHTEPLDFVDLRWHVEPAAAASAATLRLEVIPAIGAPIVFAGLRPDRVRTALALVADGRCVAATVRNAAPGVQKVLLHPALVDTQIGCQLVALDKVVFDALPAHGDNDLARALTRRERSFGLYELLYEDLGIAGRVRGSPSPSEAEIEQMKVRWYAKQQEPRLSALVAGSLADLAAPGAALAEAMQSVAACPASAPGGAAATSGCELRPYSFRQDLVGVIQRCWSTADRTWKCLESGVIELAKTVPSLSPVAYKDWQDHALSFESRSGVREKTYALTRDLDFARPEAKPRGALPFAFLAQFALSEGPQRAELRRPMIVTEGQPAIDATIDRWLADRTQGGTLAPDVAQFLGIARLFRAMLAGSLGPRFPIDKLAQLAGDLRPVAPGGPGGLASPSIRTPEWILLARDLTGVGQELAAAAKALAPHHAPASQELTLCARLLARTSKVPANAVWSTDAEWDAACSQDLVRQLRGVNGDSADDLAKAIAETAEMVLHLREERDIRAKVLADPARVMPADHAWACQ